MFYTLIFPRAVFHVAREEEIFIICKKQRIIMHKETRAPSIFTTRAVLLNQIDTAVHKYLQNYGILLHIYSGCSIIITLIIN